MKPTPAVTYPDLVAAILKLGFELTETCSTLDALAFQERVTTCRRERDRRRRDVKNQEHWAGRENYWANEFRSKGWIK